MIINVVIGGRMWRHISAYMKERDVRHHIRPHGMTPFSRVTGMICIIPTDYWEEAANQSEAVVWLGSVWFHG